jgi:acetyl-CoA carboxylase biotin carboxyl carrier protein
VVKAPTLGTIYLAPDPGSPPFVAVGQAVTESDTVVLIEAMKLFTGVTAGSSGTVAEVYVENGSFVEYDQDLMAIKLDAGRG